MMIDELISSIRNVYNTCGHSSKNLVNLTNCQVICKTYAKLYSTGWSEYSLL